MLQDIKVETQDCEGCVCIVVALVEAKIHGLPVDVQHHGVLLLLKELLLVLCDYLCLLLFKLLSLSLGLVLSLNNLLFFDIIKQLLFMSEDSFRLNYESVFVWRDWSVLLLVLDNLVNPESSERQLDVP